MNEIEIGEKLSALHDGELESSEIDELIDLVSKDTQLQKKLYLQIPQRIFGI